MSKPINSFFDEGTSGYTLWRKPTGTVAISFADIIFQSPLFKISKATKESKERYFVLTREKLFYLKSETQPKILGVMDTEWVRCDYITSRADRAGEPNYCLRFARNMRYTDLWTTDETHLRDWKRHLNRVFVQCDFHTKFNTIKMIGKGSFARVYLVENKETKERMAVKAFSKEYLLSQPKGKDSLVNEIEIMQRLKHPYIMCLEEVHESKNSVYLVLELIEGGELLNYISSKESLTFRDYWKVMRCIMEAVAYMSDKRVMHRDLKPDNMILKEKNKLESCTLKLADFGLATLCDVPEYLFKRCGTPGFVAPEVINAPSNENIHYEPKCDVFSAGVIFYILLTERSPFDGKSFKEILQKNKQCKVDFKHPRLRKHKTTLDLLQRMLEVDPEKRISARDALSHKFFTEFDDAGMTVELENAGEPHFKEYNEHFKNAMVRDKLDETNSLVIRDVIITGKTNTVMDSGHSNGMISSFKSMSSPRKAESSVKRESILKFVLMQNSGTVNTGEIYDVGFVHETFESDAE